MFQALTSRLHSAALRFTSKLAKQPAGVTGLSLLANRTRAALLRRSLLGGAGVVGGAGAASALADGGVASALGAGLGMGAELSSLAAGPLLAQAREMGLLSWLLVDLAINWAGWALAAPLKTEKFYDLFGSLSFLTLSAGSLALGGASGARKFLVSGMVGVWALRLGSYLVTRVVKTGKDARFDGVRDNPPKFFVYWTMQAVWVFLTVLPVLMINGRPAVPLTPWDAVGVAVFALGLGLEATADAQKAAFKAKPENAGRFIDEGLWSLARHPNYCGEMMLWWGVFLTAAPGFTAWWQWLAVVSPVATMLLLRHVSGVPLLEEMAQKRWGNDPAYQAYRQRTNLLLPLPRGVREAE